MWRKFNFFLVLLFWSLIGYGWTSTGHRVVAQIAYHHLTPKAKNAVDHLTEVLGDTHSGESRFVTISNWADVIRAEGDHRFSTWHYIDLPWSIDGTPIRQPRKKNAVYAISTAQSILASNAPEEEKRVYLKLLVHIVGDVHQPLHAINRISKSYPRGDLGANRFRIVGRKARNLHVYWDSGLGLFRYYEQRYPLRRGNIQKLATDIETAYPKSVFSDQSLHQSPAYWALESHDLAKKFAYQLLEGTMPTDSYQQQGQQIAKRRLALAGYRLAESLNLIFQ